jgi:uncharacterized membrane protein YkoI
MKLLALTTAMIVASGLASAQVAPGRLKVEDLPPAVQKTVQEQTRNATLVGLSAEKENGKTVYELETKVNGKGRDLMFGSDGAVLSVEEEVALDSIPPAAKAAIEKRAGGGKINRVETLTRGKSVVYEAVIIRGGKSSEFTVTAEGAPTK